MKNVSFYIKELVINRMPGFAKGLETLDLAKNINLITGPNASGKSSTSRIIQQVIWPYRTKGLDARAEIEIENKPWLVKIESESVKIQQDGIDKVIPGIPAREGCHRYLLPLHDLITENENDLAREIMKASIGGYDLDEAKNKLHYSDIVKNSSANEFKEVRAKELKYKEVMQKHQELKKEEETLRNLEADKEKSRKASQLFEFYNATAEYMEAKLACENFKSKKSSFASSMDKVIGDEMSTIGTLETKVSEAVRSIHLAESKIGEEQQKIDALKIAGKEVPETTITNLENRLQKLQTISQKLIDFESELFAKHEERCEAVKAIDENLDPLEWERLDLKIVEDLDEFTQKAYLLLATKVDLEKEKKRLQEDLEKVTENSYDPENILQGIKGLGAWIKEQVTGNDLPKWVIPGLVILGIITAVATFLFGWPGLLGILLILGLAFFGSKIKNDQNSHSIRERDFKDLNLPLPSVWNIEPVTEHISLLINLLRQSKLREDTNVKIRELDRKLGELVPELDRVQEEHKKWQEEIGAAPKLTENVFGSLYWFLNHARDWQKAHTAYKSLDGHKSAKLKDLQEELIEFNTLLLSSNLQPVNNETEADAELKNLKRQLNLKIEAESNIRNQQVDLNGYRRIKTESSDILVALYKRLIVPQGDKAAVKHLIEDLDSYNDICSKLFASEHRLNDKEIDLKNHSLYTELEFSIESLSLDEAKEKAEINKSEADKKDGISREITRIETLINEKRGGHELEDILTEKQIALEGLQNLYQTNMASVTGDLIIEQLKAETLEQNRPQVFKRANVLFNKITNGRYELRLGENNTPSFKAYDTELKQGLDLSEVSTGTRVQLLLAVRLAYVESQEKGMKLPILADELLANSDDERATAIIKALIEISKEGRQVFYFTAQADEIYKWEKILKEEDDLKFNIIALKDHRGKSNALDISAERFRFQKEVAEPGILSHQEYGKQLNVDPFNLLHQDSAQLHVWYLIDDVEVLYKCLNIGLKTWGQLESFRSVNGKIEGLTSEWVTKIEKKIKLLDRLIILSRKGRNIRIDREVLENSGAVSAKFIDEVCKKLKELDCDPLKLLNALENSEVKKFQSNNMEKLRDYFYEQQILSEEDPLTVAEIHTQLSAMISQLEIAPEEAEHFCNQFLRSSRVNPSSENDLK